MVLVLGCPNSNIYPGLCTLALRSIVNIQFKKKYFLCLLKFDFAIILQMFEPVSVCVSELFGKRS